MSRNPKKITGVYLISDTGDLAEIEIAISSPKPNEAGDYSSIVKISELYEKTFEIYGFDEQNCLECAEDFVRRLLTYSEKYKEGNLVIRKDRDDLTEI